MPGTIQVSILEVVDLPSLLPSSSMCIKVSMGKQAHETEEKGDFSFTLASFRDNLSVSIYDSEGNEVAHTGVETRSIVEKGVWDDLFPLQGGGHVHMRLCFILSEDEQNRIRSMRESATRKKQGDLVKRSNSSSDLAVSSGGYISFGKSLKDANQAQERNVNGADKQANKISASSNAQLKSKGYVGLKKQTFSTSKSTGALDKLPAYQRIKEVNRGQDGRQQNQVNKIPSSVRKIALAFESSPVKEQEALPATNIKKATTRLSSKTTSDTPPKLAKLEDTAAMTAKPILFDLETVPAPTREEIGKEREVVGNVVAACEEKQHSEKFHKLLAPSIDQISKDQNMNMLQPIREVTKEEMKSPTKLHTSPTSRECKWSWETLIQALPRRNQIATDSLTETKGLTSSVHNNHWRSKHWRPRDRVRSTGSCRNQGSSFDSLHGWIFLEEMIRFCVPISDRSSILLHDGGLSTCTQDTSQEKPTDEINSDETKSLESSKRPNEKASAGQVVKIAIMVGFGVLVLLTRQRK